MLAQGSELDQNVEDFFTRPLLALAVLVGAVVLSRLVRMAILAVLRRIARRALVRPTRWWRTRLPRAFFESHEQAEDRRQQRIDASGRMLGHLVSAVIWVAAVLVALHILRIDPLFVLTSAGFLGAALAFGGQNMVKDYLAGLTVLLEDRYGAGDRITVDLEGKEITGVVDNVGIFSTRLSDGTTTWHLANTSLGNVRNHDQSPTTTQLVVAARPAPDRDALAASVIQAVERAASSPLMPAVVLVDDVETDIETTGEHPVVRVSVRTPRAMTEHEQERLQQAVEAELSAPPGPDGPRAAR